jgi:hypothetical protein
MAHTCTICLGEITRPFFAHKHNRDGEQHPFHKRCLMKYIAGKREATCPVCRATLTSYDMNDIKRHNKASNNNNASNNVIFNSTNDGENSTVTVNRNNLGINRHHFLSYQDSMRGYFVIDRNTGYPVVENRVARFINRNNYNFVLPNNRSDRHFINYNPTNNQHYIGSL